MHILESGRLQYFSAPSHRPAPKVTVLTGQKKSCSQPRHSIREEREVRKVIGKEGREERREGKLGRYECFVNVTEHS